MAIDAIVDWVEYTEEGCVLHLIPATKTSHRGQAALTVLDPPPGLEVLAGLTIWGGADRCYMGQGDKLQFDRIGYTRLRLKPRTKDNAAN